jgi:acetyl-CoA acetyltransferase
VTVNRLCGSGLQAVMTATHALAAGWGEVMIAGGSESMSRAPLVMSKADKAFRTGTPEIVDSTLGWRFVNPRMRTLHGCLAMGETAEEVAERFDVSQKTRTRLHSDRTDQRSTPRNVASSTTRSWRSKPHRTPGVA